MRSVPPSAPDSPVLSNRLADLAERAGEAARRFRRGSIESIREYLTAGELFAEARGECRRGEWGAVLARAGIDARTAQRMMQAWRIARDSGASAETVHDAGGIQAFVAAAVEAACAAVEAAAQALDAGDVADEKPVLKTPISPDTAGDDAPVGGAEGLPTGRQGGEGTDVPPEGVSGRPERPGGLPGGRRALTLREAADADRNRREARAARGLCVSCGRERAAPGKRQGARCLERDRARTRSRLAGGRYAAALDRRLREAAAKGRGLSLSAGDVAKLLGTKAKR